MASHRRASTRGSRREWRLLPPFFRASADNRPPPFRNTENQRYRVDTSTPYLAAISSTAALVADAAIMSRIACPRRAASHQAFSWIALIGGSEESGDVAARMSRMDLDSRFVTRNGRGVAESATLDRSKSFGSVGIDWRGPLNLDMGISRDHGPDPCARMRGWNEISVDPGRGHKPPDHAGDRFRGCLFFKCSH